MRTLYKHAVSLSVLFLMPVTAMFCVLPEEAEAAIACYDCHGSRDTKDIRPVDAPFRNPSSGGFQGNHRTHMGESAAPATCSKCHPGSSDYTSSHRDGLIKVSSNINGSRHDAVYNSATSAFHQQSVRSFGTCTNVNCHFEKVSPQWGGSSLMLTGDRNSIGDCNVCHSAPPSDGKHGGKHGQYFGNGTVSCGKCHPDHRSEPKPFAHATSAGNRSLAVQFTTPPNSGGIYVNGSVTYPVYLNVSASRNGSCTNYCHSDGNKDSSGNVGPATMALTWSDTKTTQCISCHKGRTAEDNNPANCAEVGGAWDAAKGLCSPDLTMSSNGHHLLVGPQWIRKYPCYYCHNATVDTNNSLGNISSMAKHVNGKPDVAIDPKWNIIGRPNASYNPATKVCDNIYCHSDGTTDPEQVKPYAWTETNAKCNVCHGHPIGSCSTNDCHDGKLHPATATSPAKVWPIVTGWEPGKEWMGAVPMFANQGVGTARANSHPRHVQSDYACDECHAATIKGGGNCSTCHANGIPAGAMGEASHLDGDFHVNKVKDVVFKRGGSYNADKSCSNTACHKDGVDPVWGGTVGSQIVCKNCHGTTGADVDTFINSGGTIAKINLTDWVTTGHGRYSTSGRYPVSKNPAANFPGENACWYCHDNGVFHNDPNNVFRLRMHSQFSKRFEGECVYCHMTRSQAECIACHNHPESMAPQIANFSSSHTATAKWPDGTAVIRPDHRDMQNVSCLTDQATPCHSSDQKTHNSGAGVWTAEQKADVKNQYLMMGVCLQCHDDDSSGKCLGCHDYVNDKVKYPPEKYELGFNGGSGKIVPKKARASSVHFGYKHFSDFKNSGGWNKVFSPAKSSLFGTYSAYAGTWKGGKFCWDCHDPHGDKNVYMIHDQVATSTDGRFGIPYTRAAVSFTKAQSGTDYAKTTAPYNGICNVCHSTDAKHYRADGGDGHNSGTKCTICHEHRFTDSHADNQTCNTCHLNKPVPRHSAFGQPRDCTKCHAQTIAKRTDVMNSQFGGNSHHIQGVEIKSKQCYACHWEATPEGLINVTYHKGYNYLNYSSVPNSQVDLVVWGPGVRPTTYKLYSTAVQFLASNVSFGIISTERKEVAKITPHCLSCHSDQNNNIQPFGDCKTPRQYAWDKQSIAARYSQTGTTMWGKYPTNGKNIITKAFSAHGNAVANQGGYDAATGNDVPINSTRSGSNNVQCFDCHNSHGTRVVGITSSYVTFNGTRNGANLKETQAGKGGYKYNYKAKANTASGAINPYSAGGGQCFDCHANAAQNASIAGIEGYKTPWGYQTTFGAAAPIRGYADTDNFGPSKSGFMVRYPYKTQSISGGHLKASSLLSYSTAHHNKINGLCTPCHDPHGVTPTLGSKQEYAVPLLKGTWLTTPYREDAANPNTNRTYPGNTSIPSVYIDDNTSFSGGKISENDTLFAGLCMTCHSPKNPTSNINRSWLTNGTNHEWGSKDRIHESVKGWKTNPSSVKHNFACSKCHSPHVTGSKRLMITNCLNWNHNGRQVAGGAYPSGSGSGSDRGWYGDQRGSDSGGGNQPACHPAGTWPGYQYNQWNKVTPW